MTKPLRIMLADDHALFRRGVAAVLALLPDVELVGEANDGLEAIKLARKTKPDLILMDLNMPGVDGLGALKQIKEEMPKVNIIVLTVSDEDADLFEAIKAGAQGYLIKNVRQEQLLEAIETVTRGEAFLSSATTARILKQFREPARIEPKNLNTSEELTGREMQVLELVVEGLSNNQIGEVLSITGRTVKNHVSNILSKLHLQNRVQAVAYAVREGLVEEKKDT
ncbi:MAG: response regulator transcription factor [Anaerolineales bacterium]|nr:response regulator transcription factor [Anaerolineales bacterium]